MKKIYFLFVLFFCLNIAHVVNAFYDDGVFIYDRDRDYADLASILEGNKKELNDNNLSIDFSYDDQGYLQESYLIKVARDKGKVVGAIFYNAGSLECYREWQILLLIVDKSYRNKGYGSLMIESITGDMVSFDVDLVRIKVPSLNKPACHLFKNKSDFGELKWIVNPFSTYESIEFACNRYYLVEAWGKEGFNLQLAANQKLYDACKNCDAKKVQEAILEGANIHLRVNCNEEDDNDDDKYWEKRSPLYFAIEHNNIEFTKALLDVGIDITGMYEDVSPLTFAMDLGSRDLDMISLLIQAGCDVNAVDGWKNPLLHQAFRFDDLAIAKALIDAGADIYALSYCDSSLLDEAVEKDDPAFLILLIQSGYDVNRKDDEGCGGLHKAVSRVCDDVIFKTLLRAGAAVHQVNDQGHTPLDLVDIMLHEYQLKASGHYRLRAEIDQLKKIKEILSK